MSRGRFERWRVSIPPGPSRASTPDAWADAVVLVEAGTLEVRCVGGASARFGPGSLLALGWLPLASLRSADPGGVQLLAVRRRLRTDAAWHRELLPVSRWSMALAALSRRAAASAAAGEDGSRGDR